MKDWKTTIVGAASALIYYLNTSGEVPQNKADVGNLITALLLGALGYNAKDKDDASTKR